MSGCAGRKNRQLQVMAREGHFSELGHLSEQRLASAVSCQESCGKTGVCGRKSAAAGTWQCDMKLTANPELQILYCIDFKVSYMTGKILQMKDICGGVRGRSSNT